MTERAKDEAADIQGLVRTGYGSLKAARYILLRIEDSNAAKQWLSSLHFTSVQDCRESKQNQALQIAFTAAGLAQLGLNADALEHFSPEFVDGMVHNESRSRRLGDVGTNAPEHWDWGAGDQEPHVLLLAFARPEKIQAIEETLRAEIQANGCILLRCQPSSDMDGREPFGFQDGISQPKMDWDGALQPGGAKDRDYRNRMAAGEVLLGHSNEYGFVADYPRDGDIGRNGSYLVYRQLAQDVTGFWQWLRDETGPEEAKTLAETMVGRTIDGQPLSGLAKMEGSRGRNAFDFSGDVDGVVCPIGSHIRRVNPRLGDHPGGNIDFLGNLIGSLGLGGTAKHDAVASSRFHRILRRGRPYGKTMPYEQAMQPGAEQMEAGLHFLCLNASLARQFEFVQGAWIASPAFAGLAGEQDPILGDRDREARGHDCDQFSYFDEDRVPRRIDQIPQFVNVRGGAYFFLPGLNGLREILK
ncbi:hypothetical protein [Pontixanthobacter sp. CEM42]|uniref:Dyp-type peroxidase n=1 Tax=Pontixanthobacter sp. CEM42 TaxID=2792077 RepID=UPI001ADF52AA|nr:hypothetical protein [Pontixanthobacter sp. CEM42]